MSAIVANQIVGENRLPTFRETMLTGVEGQKKVIKRTLEIAAHISIYYPDSADYYTSEGFVKVFMDGIKSEFPNLLIEDVEHAIHKGMITYRYHTAPKLNDLFQMVAKYNETRVEWVEKAIQNKKVAQNSFQVADNVLDVFKKAQTEAAEELDEKNKEENKRAKKLKEQAKKEFEKMRPILDIYAERFKECEHDVRTEGDREYCAKGCDGFQFHKKGYLTKFKKK